MKHNLLLIALILGSTFSLSAQKMDYLNFADTAFRIKSFHPFESSWIVVDTNYNAYYYDNPDSNVYSLNKFQWKKALSAKEFDNKIWVDNQFVYFQNKNAIERVDKQTGKSLDVLSFKGISSQPFYKNEFAYFMGFHNDENSLICYNTKKKKVVWASPAPHHFNTPVFTSRSILTRDSFDTPVAVSYENAELVYPAIYEQSCPFKNWNDMFFGNGNDFHDSFFYLNGFIYSVNFEMGFLRKYYPTQYPVPIVSVDINQFRQEINFNYAYDNNVHFFYNNYGFQIVTETDLDSLKNIKYKSNFGTPMPVNPLRKPDFFKIKSTTETGNFNDFGSAKLIGLVHNQYMVFAHNDQLIGVNPKMGRTYNFPRIYFPIDKYWVQGNVMYFSSESYGVGILRVEMNRVWTEEELEQLKPPQEVMDKYPHIFNQSE